LELLSSDLITHLTQTMDDISHISDHVEIHHTICKLLMRFTDSDFATLLLYKPNEQYLYTKDKKEIHISTKAPQGLVGYAFLTKKPLLTNNPISHKEFVEEVDALDKRKLKAQILFPLLENDTLKAIIYVSRSKRYAAAYTKNEMHLLASLQTFLIKIVHILSSENELTLKVDKKLIRESTLAANFIEDKKEIKNHELINFSNIVHDINTPANALYGFLKLMEEHTTDKQLKMFIENAKESAKLINTLTDSILEESKQNFTLNVSHKTMVNSIKYFSKITNLFSANMHDKKIKYIIYFDPKIPKEIEIDDIKLQRVIMNLIGNAYKFTQPHKHIYFNVSYNNVDKQLNVLVSDEGIGMEKEKEKEISALFDNIDKDNVIQREESGLGLSISAKFIKELGGKLELMSTIDKGSTLSFSIPIHICNEKQSFQKFIDLNKKVTILTDYPQNSDAQNIQKYLLALGLPIEKINIGKHLNNPTHLYCFEHKLTPEIIQLSQKTSMKLLIIEEKLFSLTSKEKYNSLNITSINTFYGDKIHSNAFSVKPKRIIIADNNKINIKLLEAILSTEFVEITSTLDGEEALKHIKNAHLNDNPYDMIFVANDLPIIRGKELISKSKEYTDHPIYTISTSCKHNMIDTDKKTYDMILTKPFNKNDIRSVIEI